jgi:hypothetical protein
MPIYTKLELKKFIHIGKGLTHRDSRLIFFCFPYKKGDGHVFLSIVQKWVLRGRLKTLGLARHLAWDAKVRVLFWGFAAWWGPELVLDARGKDEREESRGRSKRFM